MNTNTKKTLRIIALTLELVQDLVRDNRIRLLEERVTRLERGNELERKVRLRRMDEARRSRVDVQNPFLTGPRHPASGTGFTAKDL